MDSVCSVVQLREYWSLKAPWKAPLTPSEPVTLPLPVAPALAVTDAEGPCCMLGIVNVPPASPFTPADTSPEALMFPSAVMLPVISPPRLSVLPVFRVIWRTTWIASLVQLIAALPKDLTVVWYSMDRRLSMWKRQSPGSAAQRSVACRTDDSGLSPSNACAVGTSG